MKISFFVGMYCFSMHLGQGQEHEATPLIASAETSIQQKSHHVLQSRRLCSATLTQTMGPQPLAENAEYRDAHDTFSLMLFILIYWMFFQVSVCFPAYFYLFRCSSEFALMLSILTFRKALVEILYQTPST